MNLRAFVLFGATLARCALPAAAADAPFALETVKTVDDAAAINENFRSIGDEVRKNNMANGGTVNGSLTVTGQVKSVNSVAAWVHFVGTGTVVILDAVGVSSITDHGTGDYSVNFSVNFTNPNFVCTCAAYESGAIKVCVPGIENAIVTGHAFRVNTTDTSFAAEDVERVMVQCVGRT